MMKIINIEKEIKDIIEKYPYFISVGLGNNWNKNVSLDKAYLLKALNEFNWKWYLEESYINDYIYSLIIKFDFSEKEPEYIKELYINDVDMYEDFALYISKEVYEILLKVYD